jgi:hypothetical protein
VEYLRTFRLCVMRIFTFHVPSLRFSPWEISALKVVIIPIGFYSVNYSSTFPRKSKEKTLILRQNQGTIISHKASNHRKSMTYLKKRHEQ